MTVRTPFTAEAAERYHHGRPAHHARTLNRVAADLPPAGGRAVDMACETLAEVTEWLHNQTAAFFDGPDEPLNFTYWGRVELLRPTN